MTDGSSDWSKYKAHTAKLTVERVRRKGGGRRLQEAHMYPELLRLRANGWTQKEMARYIGYHGGPRTARRYGQIIQWQGKDADPTSTEQLPPDVQEMLQWNLESFGRFYATYSPYPNLPKHKRSWVQAFLRHRRVMLNVPPGHGKSELFMVWIPIWLICRDRNVQLLLVSNSSDDATTWAKEVAGQLEGNEDLVGAFGRFMPETIGDTTWSPARGIFRVLGRTRSAKGSQFTLESRGITSRVLGRRADYVLVDDPTKQEDAASPTTRDVQLRHLRQQVFTRAEPEGEFNGGRIAVIGQRVHMLDLYGELERQEWERGPDVGERVWKVEKYPAVLDWEAKKTLWPERWPWDEIELAYADVGSNAFETMYQQNPTPEGSALVQPAWLAACKDHDRPAYQGFRMTNGARLPVVRVVSVDPSPTKFNGIVVADLLWNREQFSCAVTEIVRVQGRTHAVKNEVERIISESHPDYFIFEESNFISWVKEDPWFAELEGRIHYVRHHTGVNKNHAEYGLQSLAADFELARLSFPYKDAIGQRMTDMLFREALEYPDGQYNDLLMALWFIKYNYKRLAPPNNMMPTRVRGMGGDSTWSFIKQLKRKKQDSQDARYRAWQKAKEKKRDDERVSVG